MKKLTFIFLGLFISVASWAQCPTEETGSYPVPVDSSLLTINGARRADCDAYIKGKCNPLYVHRCGTPNNGYMTHDWFFGVLSESDMVEGGYNHGVVGRVMNDGSHATSGRAYGVMGTANGFSSGYTYGVFGRLEGTKNGAAIFGTNRAFNSGIDTQGRYAGYFYGSVKVTDTLRTATLQANAYLVRDISGTSAAQSAMTYAENDDAPESTCQKLNSLSSYTFIPEQPVTAISLDADTVDYESASLHDEAYYSRPHHGLSAEEILEVFPELVYEDTDGSKSVNYIELIPILLEAVKELKNEVEVLKGNGTSPMHTKKQASVNTDGVRHTSHEVHGNNVRYTPQGIRVSSSSNNSIAIRNDGRKIISE